MYFLFFFGFTFLKKLGGVVVVVAASRLRGYVATTSSKKWQQTRPASCPV